jgi:beta-phosphoglucomutase
MKKLNVRPEAIIFDMDGVIVDSMPYHFIAWYEALRPWGIRVTCFDIYAKEGEKWDKTLKDLFSRAHIKVTSAELQKIFDKRQQIFKKYFKRFIFKSVEELLRCLKQKKYRLALVTGTPAKELQRILPGNIKQYFDYMVAGDQVERGKPFPEPYLKAASLLNVTPSKCLVIENAPYGITAAKKAGMFCVAVTTSLPKEYLQKADLVVDSLEEIAGIIDSSCRIR